MLVAPSLPSTAGFKYALLFPLLAVQRSRGGEWPDKSPPMRVESNQHLQTGKRGACFVLYSESWLRFKFRV